MIQPRANLTLNIKLNRIFFCFSVVVGATSTVAMLGYGLATLLVLGSQGWFFQRTLRQTDGTLAVEAGLTRHWQEQMFAYAWPFAVWGGFTWA